MTRRLLETLALGSTTGAGGIGAAEGSWTWPCETPQPQASQPTSHPASQQLLRCKLPNSRESNPRCRLGAQQLSQVTASQPQAGAAWQGSQATSQPQAGSGQQPGAAPQGPQATSQPQAGSQTAASQQLRLWCENNLLSRPPRLPQWLGGQAQGSQAASQPQAGAAWQGSQATSQPQAGSGQQPGAAPQGSQATSQPQPGSHGGGHPISQQLEALPHPRMPSMRSNRSKPKLWLQTELASTMVKVSKVRFIGATSPYHAIAG